MDGAATSIAAHIIEKASIVAQVKLRLMILAAWFGDLETARRSLSERVVLECGCGQGDMTVTLASLVQTASSERGKVLAIDPADLDYGSPATLGEAQAHISRTQLGRTIDWIQMDPMDYVKIPPSPGTTRPDFIVLALSIFYLPSETYFAHLLRTLHEYATGRGDAGKRTTLLLSDWGMQASEPSAQAHVLAVRAQAASPRLKGNVQTVIVPDRIITLATESGWQLQREVWIQDVDADDGKWEIASANRLDLQKVSAETRGLITEMNELRERHGDPRSMHVWTGKFSS